MRTVIIDDEFYAIEGLKFELEKFPEISVIATFQNGDDFLEKYQEIKPELVFLDIEMPGLNGFDISKKIIETSQEKAPKIVFVTAYKEYAVDACDVNEADYLVKPVSPERLALTVARLVPSQEIEIKTFGSFSVLKGNREILLKWRSKKAEELFLYLLMKKGQLVSKEKIAGDLWPNLDLEKGSANLYLSLYYIKQTLKNAGLNINIESFRGKMRINIENVNLDLLLIDKFVNNKDFNKLEKYINSTLLENYYFEWNEENRRYYETQVAKILKR